MKKRKQNRGMMEWIARVLLTVWFISMIPIQPIQAATAVPASPPQNLRVLESGFLDAQGYNWFAEFGWNVPVFPNDPVPVDKGLIFYLNEIQQGSGTTLEDVMQVPLSTGVTSFKTNEYLPNDLKHGNIYEIYGRSWYTFGETGQYTSTSQKSVPTRFLTGLHVGVELVPGTNQIKIKWDDVWDKTGRISYRILISDTKGFTQPAPIPDILSSEIGTATSPVTVNTAERKLEYVYNFALPGREYAIKVIPLAGPTVTVVPTDRIVPVSIKTDILLKAQKVGYTDSGVIWKLFWNPIVKGDTYTKVDYEMYRYVGTDPQGRLFALVPDQDYLYITIPNNDTTQYSFRVDALAYTSGGGAPLEFRSNNKVQLKETIPEQPVAPVLVDSFLNADPDPLVFDDLLTPNSATVLWEVPKTGDGQVDTLVTYDIFLVNNVQDVASPPNSAKIATSFVPGPANEVNAVVSGQLIGYRYDLLSLQSNSTYYFVIQAKKNYLVPSSDGDFMITMPFVSKASVKVIITEPDAGADRPVAPPSPPFRLKPGEGNLTQDGATLTIKKMWHQLYDETLRKWVYVTQEDWSANELLPDANPAKRKSSIVNYPAGWQVQLHAVNFTEALFVVGTLKGREYIAYSDLMQPYIKNIEIQQDAVPVPNLAADADQDFDLPLAGLEHNTSYIVWATVINADEKTSDASDPLVITTLPQYPDTVVIPTVPVISQAIAADTFVDLFWNYRLDLNYQVKYALEDDIEKAKATLNLTGASLADRSFYRVDALDPSTFYYVWVKAINPTQTMPGTGGAVESAWSNSYLVKTEAYKPPAVPTGFGVKEGTTGVTVDTISYEWTDLPGLTYVLEFAENTLFKESKTFEISGGAHTVTGLTSNRRYYARLYAVDTKTKLKSLPTGTIMVITNRSRNEYDASYDLDDKPTGDVLKYGTVGTDGLWTVTSTGVQADRLAEDLRQISDSVVQIDLRKPPGVVKTVRLELGTQVMDTLAALNKELLVRTPSSDITVRPGSLQTDDYFRIRSSKTNPAVRFDIRSPVPEILPATTMKLKTPLTNLQVLAGSSAGFGNLSEFVKPVRMAVPVSGIAGYQRDELALYSHTLASGWIRQPSKIDYTNGFVSADISNSSTITAATRSTSTAASTPAYVLESLHAIQKQFTLKSLEGSTFQATSSVTNDKLSRLMLDLMRVNWQPETTISTLVKAGMLDAADVTNPSGSVRKDMAIAAAVALYRKKTGDAAKPEAPDMWQGYTDLSSVRTKYLQDVRFATETGIIRGSGTGRLNPGTAISMGDLIVIMERALTIAGEL